MSQTVLQTLKVPPGLPVSRYRETRVVQLPSTQTELPLIDKKTPPEKQVQEVWVAQVGVFNLADDAQRKKYEEVWQRVCNKIAIVSESRTEFHNGSYIALLRWADFEYKLPPQA